MAGEVDAVVGMNAPVEDVHHRNGQQVGIDAADIAIEGQPDRIGRCFCRCKADAQDRIGTKATLVLRPVEIDERGIDIDLVLGFHSDHCVGDFAVHGLDGVADALPAPAALVAVTKFHGLVRSGRGARRHGSAAHAAVFEGDVHLDCRIAAAVEDLARVDVDDSSHGFPSCGGVTIWVYAKPNRPSVRACNFRCSSPERRPKAPG
jgi:hypothetical protein